ncbi:hypothetical protein [Bosea sp. 124]|uniref:hypothetical protein n=1 Tax=Bosea sp. 124 TaxID=2135642 RepID=UPI000D4B560F|nr:hypothetical protein [Bosea sp. 124]PTM41733.1 hypothetical protein C8D03_3306 [Bosea sp. 124]
MPGSSWVNVILLVSREAVASLPWPLIVPALLEVIDVAEEVVLLDRYYLYKVCDFIVTSEFELSELSPISEFPAGLSEVRIMRAEIAKTLPDATRFGWIEANRTSCLFKINDTARLRVIEGRRIEIEPGQLSPREIGAYIIGCGLPILAHMRRYVPLHIGMASTPYGVVMFTGPSGAGKSTAVAALSRRLGWQLLCDDICIITPAAQPPTAYCDVNKIKLWSSAVEELGYDAAVLESDLIRPQKFHLAVAPGSSVDVSEVRAVFKLSWANEAALCPISRPLIFETLMNSVHAPFLVPVLGELDVIRTLLSSIASSAKGFQLQRDKSAGSIATQIDLVQAALTQ